MYIPENTTIDISVIQKMPARISIMCFEEVTDMDGKKRRAVMVMWQDREVRDTRTAHFCADTGDYLGEC